jgi:hypothetical protein
MAMNNVTRNIGLLILPFLMMVAVNQLYSPPKKNTTYSKFGIITQNGSKKISTSCTWACHNNTIYCKNNHVKFNKKYFKYTDSLYFGAIKSLKKTNNYAMANIFLFVVLVPLGIWFFIAQSLNINSKIRQLKKQNKA